MSVEGHRHDQYSQTDHTHSTAATAAVDTNTTQIATTAFVIGQAASATPIVNGTAAVGASTRFARGDHVHPTDTGRAASVHTHAESDVTSLVTDLGSKAALAGAAFTGNVSVTGTLSATSTVSASGLAGSLLSSAAPLINGTAAQGASAIPSRQDHVHPTDTTRSDLVSPNFTGTPTISSAKIVSSKQAANNIIAQASFVGTTTATGEFAVATSLSAVGFAIVSNGDGVARPNGVVAVTATSTNSFTCRWWIGNTGAVLASSTARVNYIVFGT